MTLLGYMFTVCEFCPPKPGKSCEIWAEIRYLDHRDTIEDAQKIIDVLNETDTSYTSYGIVARPIYSNSPFVSAVIDGADIADQDKTDPGQPD